jgi:hypothetical protein
MMIGAGGCHLKRRSTTSRVKPVVFVWEDGVLEWRSPGASVQSGARPETFVYRPDQLSIW